MPDPVWERLGTMSSVKRLLRWLRHSTAQQVLFRDGDGTVAGIDLEVRAYQRNSDHRHVVNLHLGHGKDCVSFEVFPDDAREWARTIVEMCDACDRHEAEVAAP